jgi:signal transduction histidine kinase
VTALGKLFRTTVFKISVAYLVLFAIGAGIVLWRVGWNVEELIDEQISQTIDADITGLAEQYQQGSMQRLVSIIDRRIRQPGAGLYLLTTYAGEPITGNVASLPAGVLDRPGLIEITYQRPGETKAAHRALARVFALPGGFHLLVGHDLEEEEGLRHILSGALVSSLIWLIIIGTLGSLLVARRVLHRVDAINAHARTIVAGDLSGRLPLAGSGDELDRLVLNLNGMLERIAELMHGLREVSDNIAHDLRTPLTRLRGGAEQALRSSASPADYRLALEKVIDEADGMIRIFDALLMIARAEAGAGPGGMLELDVGAVAHDVAELYEPLAEERGAVLAVEAVPGLRVHGSRELVGQAVANLVDNALKYGVGDNVPPQITIGAQSDGATVSLTVADRGPGIPAQDRTRVLDRFVRLENARSRPGYGLGLSLAAAVARLHGGALHLEDNAPGLRVVITLPAAAAPLAIAPPAAAADPPSAAA